MIKTITLHPSRIGCPSLPGTMKGIISSFPGVQDVKVRYEERSLDITFDDSKTSEQEFIKKIGEELGLAMEVGETNSTKEGNVADTCPM
jgi:copper chaperone CopZ